MWDLGADSFNQIGAHEQPITCCGFAKGPNYECLVTGSLDKTVKLWDMRQSNPVMTFNCPEVKYGQFLMHSGKISSTASYEIACLYGRKMRIITFKLCNTQFSFVYI